MTTATRSLLVTLVPTLFAVGCTSGPPLADSIYEGQPSRYGNSGSNSRDAGSNSSNRYGAGSSERENARDESRNRFGYGNANDASETAPEPASRERSDRRRPAGEDAPSSDTIADAPKPEDKPVDPPAPKPSGGRPAVADMPYARGVPGNPLAVTIPGYSYVGQVSIEKLDKSGNPAGEPQAPGTAVSIPDPKTPGKQIYFRVP